MTDHQNQNRIPDEFEDELGKWVQAHFSGREDFILEDVGIQCMPYEEFVKSCPNPSVDPSKLLPGQRAYSYTITPRVRLKGSRVVDSVEIRTPAGDLHDISVIFSGKRPQTVDATRCRPYEWDNIDSREAHFNSICEHIETGIKKITPDGEPPSMDLLVR